MSELLKCIDCVVEQDNLAKLRKAESYALLADEPSDEAHREQFAVLVRFKDCRQIKELFLGIIELKRTDAESFMTAIQNFLTTKGVDITKAVFVGFDGCNVMSGENKGKSHSVNII